MMNKTKTECATELCQYNSATRTRFYNGMLLTDEHLRAEQNYFREALRRLTRHLFGWGVVCGLTVETNNLCIQVKPGVAIDCCGNLIEVCKCITLDLSKECKERFGADCIPQTPQDPFKKYLVLHYVEKETDPEPVLTPADDCALPDDKPNCQASKVREGFCLELWDRCPCAEREPEDNKGLFAALLESSENYQRAQQATTQTQSPLQAQQGVLAQPISPGRNVLELPRCSPCGCCENAVGLAVLTIDCANNTVEREYKCRRDVISPRLLDAIWYRVRNAMTAEIAELDPRLAYNSTANQIALAINHEQSGDRLKILEDRVQELSKGMTRLEKRLKKSAQTNP